MVGEKFALFALWSSPSLRGCTSRAQFAHFQRIPRRQSARVLHFSLQTGPTLSAQNGRKCSARCGLAWLARAKVRPQCTSYPTHSQLFPKEANRVPTLCPSHQTETKTKAKSKARTQKWETSSSSPKGQLSNCLLLVEVPPGGDDDDDVKLA